ncbi:MAG: PBP1A family penicillin-binding protein [Candidatus Nitrohelix vancouverensis]|uniref:Penicillin-binding protein 1A n=1 Tax=Candidatus Nitrohelix vancouverensis TaxID=2705534 RepID=A0A7T0C583_9BACT|nr:MAG: PBP1A family penicillin-binding protein [Candidatus Nitrohelix vancouverensis]
MLVDQKLKKKKKKKKRKQKPVSRFKKTLKITWLVSLIFFLFSVVAGSIGAGFIYFKYSKDLPDVRALKDFQPSLITRVYSNTDEKIAEFYIEKRIMVPLEEIPLRLKQATLAVEDSNFYYHFGIDPKAIFRAMLTNFKAGYVVEGGSTITQQLTKTLLLSSERTIIRKIKEAILAVRMELIFTKDQILEMYLNQIYYGHGSYGIEAAARTYFAKPSQQLTIAECAMLASLPKAPNNYSPYRNATKAKKRRNHVIRRMAHLNFINDQEAQTALTSDFNLGEVTDMLNRAPYFVEHIRQFLIDLYGANKLYRGGLNVYTTLDIRLQELAQASIREGLENADKRFGYRGPRGYMDASRPGVQIETELRSINKWKDDETPKVGDVVNALVTSLDDKNAYVLTGAGEGVIELEQMNWARQPNPKVDGRWARINRPSQALNPGDRVMAKIVNRRSLDHKWGLALEQEPEVEGALISIDPHTGHIKSMVGGYDFNKSQFNRSVQAVRQPGSVFKPIIYAAALEEGYTPSSIIVDSPIIFKEKDHAFDKWKPVNFEEKFYGPTPLRTALAHSRNIVTVKLLQNIGISKAVGMARNLGISQNLSKNLSIALGSSGVTLFELVSAYSAFANQGQRIEPIAVRSITNHEGETLYTETPKLSNPLTPAMAYTITSLLQSVVQEGTAKKVKALNRPTAGKTGTTNNYVDAWFLGYTPELLTGVWVGKDKDDSMGVNETGSRTAIPIWLNFMQGALIDAPVVNFPETEDIIYSKIHPESGEPLNFFDPDTEFEIFSKDGFDNLMKKNAETGPENSF